MNGIDELCGMDGMLSPPRLVLDADIAVQTYERVTAALDPFEVHYALKCQPDLAGPLAAVGARFEVASYAEIQRLLDIGVPADHLVFSHPVKPISEIAAAYAAGIRLFAAGGRREIAKLAAAAPGSQIMVRLATRAAATDVPSEGKFGLRADRAAALLVEAHQQGLEAAGITWHVGSQCRDPGAWVQPIEDAARVMRDVRPAGVKVTIIDLGGGFPAEYGDGPPPIETYGAVLRDALEAHLPHPVDRVIAEPGRAIAAPAGVMVTGVRGVTDPEDSPDGRRYVHLTAGAAHGFFEALEGGEFVWPATDSRGGAPAPCVLAGPSCDSQDPIGDAMLSADIDEGDFVLLTASGAYTSAYTNRAGFNGLPVPDVVLIDSGDPRAARLTRSPRGRHAAGSTGAVGAVDAAVRTGTAA